MSIHRSSRRISFFIAVVALSLFAAGCADGSDAGADDKPTIVVSTTIWGDVVSSLVGDDADVEVLMPVGADPHDFELSSRQIASLQSADLVVVNGLGLEEGIIDAVEAAEEDGANVLEVAAAVDPIPFGDADAMACDLDAAHEHDHDHDEADHDDDHDEADHDEADHDDDHDEADHDDDHDEADHDDDHDEADHDDDHDEADHDDDLPACDPHVWMDPQRVAIAVGLIVDELEALDSGVDWQAAETEYLNEIDETDAEVDQVLSTVESEDRELVTNHDALGYLAARYDFEVVATVIPGGTTLGSTSSAELAELVEVMQEHDINAIFTDNSAPADLAEAVGAELGGEVAVVELFTGSLGGPDSGAETLIDLWLTNANRIANALGG